MCADISKGKLLANAIYHPSCTKQPATHYGRIQTPLPMCPFPSSIVEGCRHVFAPRFGPIAVRLGDEWVRTSTSVYPTMAVSCTRGGTRPHQLWLIQNGILLLSPLPAQSFANVWDKLPVKTQRQYSNTRQC